MSLHSINKLVFIMELHVYSVRWEHNFFNYLVEHHASKGYGVINYLHNINSNYDWLLLKFVMILLQLQRLCRIKYDMERVLNGEKV
jgi:hypothetical protein